MAGGGVWGLLVGRVEERRRKENRKAKKRRGLRHGGEIVGGANFVTGTFTIIFTAIATHIASTNLLLA